MNVIVLLLHDAKTVFRHQGKIVHDIFVDYMKPQHTPVRAVSLVSSLVTVL